MSERPFTGTEGAPAGTAALSPLGGLMGETEGEQGREVRGASLEKKCGTWRFSLLKWAIHQIVSEAADPAEAKCKGLQDHVVFAGLQVKT